LLIPKIGTNLKDIIGLILNIEGMEGEKFDEYRQRLNKATSTLTEVQARVQLLNQLAAAVGDKGKRDRSKLTDEQNYLVDELDSLLYDPFFREYWLKDGGIIHRLVIHTLGHQDTSKVVEEMREFSSDDLPLNVLDLPKAGQQAQEFYSFLISDDNIQKATVDWLNRHRDEAITQVLNLGREDLQRLMREVRETLADKGIELVLLIEDFAKLQGIDLEVLEAVLAQPQQPESKPLCAMRTALACTTGYYDGLVKRFDTVLQRVTLEF
jgi:ABC-type phosphate transport system auxiliary subunit